MMSRHTRKRSEGSEYELPNWSWVMLEGNPPQLVLGGFVSPVPLKSSRSLSQLIFVCCWGENKKETEASKGCTGKGLGKNEIMQAPTLKHMHAPTQAASWKALLSVRLSSWEERGLDRQRRKENRTRRFGFGSWFGAKEDECEKIWRGGGARCQIWCLSRSCGAVCQNAEGGEPNTVSTEAPQRFPEAADTHQRESPSAMTRRHLSTDLDWLVPKTSRPPQMSPNQF